MLPAVKEDFAVVKKTASRFLQIKKVCLRGYHGLAVLAVISVKISLFGLVLFQFSHEPKSQNMYVFISRKRRQ